MKSFFPHERQSSTCKNFREVNKTILLNEQSFKTRFEEVASRRKSDFCFESWLTLRLLEMEVRNNQYFLESYFSCHLLLILPILALLSLVNHEVPVQCKNHY
jgi:hypothetical protein